MEEREKLKEERERERRNSQMDVDQEEREMLEKLESCSFGEGAKFIVLVQLDQGRESSSFGNNHI